MAVPGDTVGNFGSALHLLSDRATYLYSDGDRYWYDTQASVDRMARDYADRLRDRPEESGRRSCGGCARGRLGPRRVRPRSRRL